MTKEPEKTEGKAVTIIQGICKTVSLTDYTNDLKGSGIEPERFRQTALMAIQSHNEKEKLEKADRQSLYLAIKKAAQDGLMPDNKEAALVIYGSVVNYQPMVYGIVKLMRQSGEVDDADAFIVHKNDKFIFRAGVDKMPDHQADWFAEPAERGEPIGVWAFVKLTNGERRIVMLTKNRIDRIASRSKQSGNYNPKSGKDWEEFWKKAAIRNVSKLAPKTKRLEQALKADDEEFDFATDSVTHEPSTTVVKEEPRTETRASEGVRNRTGRNNPMKNEAPPPSEKDQSEDTGQENDGAIDAEFSDIEEEDEIPV